MQPGGTELAFIDCDRLADHLRDHARRYRDAYMARAGEVPEADLIAGAMLLALRNECASPLAVAAMHAGLRVIACEVVAEALN